MAAWILKNPLTAALAVLCLLLTAAVVWIYTVSLPSKYRAGEAAATAKISAEVSKAQAKQTAETLQKERAAAEQLAAAQAEIEKEKSHAETVITGLRGELGRLQQYARNQGNAGNLPETTGAARAPDDEAVTKGWQLFGKCAAEYAGMAEIADHQRNDLAEWRAYGEAVAEFR